MPRDKTVLIVDDEPNIRGFLAMVLEDEGYSVETATNGCDGLNKARELSPDAILLDLLMPVLDGVGFMREWRSDPAWGSVPVLLMSAGDTPARTEALGTHGVLLKPFDLDALLNKLASVL